MSYPGATDSGVDWQARSLEGYLRLAAGIARQDGDALETRVRQARERYRRSQTVDNRLRLALLLSGPGRSVGDMSEAAQLLGELSTGWEPRRRGLTEFIELRSNEVDERLRALQELSRLEERAEFLQQENENVSRQYENLARELEKVRAALAEAETKIDALMSIERSIERPAGESE